MESRGISCYLSTLSEAEVFTLSEAEVFTLSEAEVFTLSEAEGSKVLCPKY
ncbi:hypothetical protein [Scytonema sp. PCC 10023]|uniref:hypothetical protein n=1 Tax=Scytonema sp. PCC 10023 TaxID=1680591 RepID=UPI0039C6F54D